MRPAPVFFMAALLATCTCVLGAPQLRAASPEQGPQLDRATEVLLPPFQQEALRKDLPMHDVRFAGGQTLFLLGPSALWEWQIEARTLRRLVLWRDEDAAQQTPLRRLGGDGNHLFAVADNALFQVQWEQGRVFRYPLTSGGAPLGFAGGGDDFWLLQETALRQFDRYGKTLLPRLTIAQARGAEHAVFDSEHKVLWYTHKKQLLTIDISEPRATPKVALTAKHQLLGLSLAPGLDEVLVYTHHAVLRLSLDGQLKRSIPVDGQRRLNQMFISREAHAYLFDDELLEIYRPKSKTIQRYRLPLDEDERVSLMSTEGSYLAVVAGGRPRLFRLDTEPQKR